MHVKVVKLACSWFLLSFASSVPWIVFVHGQADCGNLQFLINFSSFYLQRYVEAQCCMASNDYKGILYFIWNHLIIDCMLVLDAWSWIISLVMCLMGIALGPISSTQNVQNDKFYCKLFIWLSALASCPLFFFCQTPTGI